MPRRELSQNVFDAALDRMLTLYNGGHRVVVSFSAGKDSGVCVELAVIAATIAGRLPVDVVMRDEEIMYPGTFEYAERIAARPDIRFHWIVARQPVINVFNRRQPYFWVFDPTLQPSDWVRQPPEFATYISDQCIQGVITPERFPAEKGKDIVSIIGLRTQESMNRKMGLHSSGGYMTKANDWGVRNARPIYDWKDGDIWKAIKEYGWDYNKAYDTMHRLGVSRSRLRIAPPTLAAASVEGLAMAAQAWPQWFDRVCRRLPGVRTAAAYGRRVVEPTRALNETWQQCYQRVCIDEAPEWIAQRAKKARDMHLREHQGHSTEQFPEVNNCPKCKMTGSWRSLARVMYCGDPFSMKVKMPYVEPEFFREGAGNWSGKPTW